MSRLGKQPVPLPSGVSVEIANRNVRVSGPKGKLSWDHHPSVEVRVESETVKVEPCGQGRLARALHGTTRQLIQNMVHGVTQGFERKLEIIGVGYNARVEGKELVINIGFCHPVNMAIPEGIEVETPSNTQLVIRGLDKQKVGQFAANVRRVRPPEPYKGKGIKYDGEFIRRKATKSFGTA